MPSKAGSSPARRRSTSRSSEMTRPSRRGRRAIGAETVAASMESSTAHGCPARAGYCSHRQKRGPPWPGWEVIPPSAQLQSPAGVYTNMKLLMTLAAAAALTAAVPVFADTSSSSSTPSAQQQCRTERGQMGKATFAQTYGTNANRSNAFGKCVAKRNAATDNNEQQAHTNASQQCRTEQAGDPAAFTTKYGTGPKGRDAFGKCVSQKAKTLTNEATKQDIAADVSASKQCRTERASDPAAFKTKYGTNHNKSNAFGKCVSQKAKAQEDAQSNSSSS